MIKKFIITNDSGEKLELTIGVSDGHVSGVILPSEADSACSRIYNDDGAYTVRMIDEIACCVSCGHAISEHVTPVGE